MVSGEVLRYAEVVLVLRRVLKGSFVLLERGHFQIII
jgi:hypothetical protein